MIAIRTARHQAAEPAPRRDSIRFLLLHRIEWTDQHPGLMLACVIALMLLGGVLEGLLP
jgi:hypothetical protein